MNDDALITLAWLAIMILLLAVAVKWLPVDRPMGATKCCRLRVWMHQRARIEWMAANGGLPVDMRRIE